MIEIDWDSHDNKVEYDTERDNHLSDLWIRIVKYSNDDILNNFDSIKEDINNIINIRKKALEENNKLDSFK